MIAGLLGEHLASPRTAQKTNQSTALDPKTAKGGDSAHKDEFASLVSKESEPAAADAPLAETPVASPPTATADRANAISLEQAVLTAPEIDANASIDAAEVNLQIVAETPDADPVKSAVTLTSQAPTGEVLTQDPRVRAQAEPRETTRADGFGTVKLVETDATFSAPPPSESDIALDTEAEIDPRLQIRGELADPEADVPRPTATFGSAEVANIDAQARQSAATDVSSFDRLLTGGLSREAGNVTAEHVLTTAPVTTTSSAPSSVSVNGLTPTAPSIPLATPNELTGIIVNAINNGLDPKEQLVVQLDPPELGRVMIDFKFDAQGLQQVVVTTENPEALKRLRELHFELTQALKEHGLSEQNMSFRQEAEGQSQDAWGSDNSTHQNAQFFAAEDRRASPSATPNGPRPTAQERLDLLL